MIGRISLIFSLVFGLAFIGHSQTINTKFGKNRVQYHDDFNNWWMYETDHFVTFWYGKGRNIAKTVIQIAEMDHDEIQGLLEHRMNDKIRIIVYLDLSDYKQSNIAYWDNNQASGAGIAQFYDNKVIVFFDGNHQHLRKQIRAGIAKAYLKSMFSGISIQEIYQNLVSTEMPKWFIVGLIDFLTEEWNYQLDEDLAYFFSKEKKSIKHFSKFAGRYPGLAGHSMWYFLAKTYGAQAFSDFLYMMRINKDIDRAFNYVYGVGTKLMYRDWRLFYEMKYPAEAKVDNDSKIASKQLIKSKFPITRILLDPKAENVVYVENNYGKIKLKKKNLVDDSEVVLLNYGYKNKHQLTDFHYPLIKYDSTGRFLAVIYEKKDKLFLRLHDLENERFVEQLFPGQIQRIYSFDFYRKGIFVLSASTDGFSDLYLYEMEKRLLERLTHDFYDEIEVVRSSWNGKRGLWVLSNTGKSEIMAEKHDSFPPTGNFDLFFYDESKDESIRMLHTPEVNEREIIEGDDYVVLLNDNNRKINSEVRFKSDSSLIWRNLNTGALNNILTHDFSNSTYAYVYKWDDNFYLLNKEKIDMSIVLKSSPKENFINKPDNYNQFRTKNEVIDNGEFLEIDSALLFQAEFPDPEIQNKPSTKDMVISAVYSGDKKAETKKANENIPIFNSSRAIASRLRFSFSELTTKVDNEALFEGLETYTRFNSEYAPPPSGFLVKVAVKDLFEDHIIEGGFRVASDFKGMEYFMSYDRLKRKIDWKFSIYRRTESRYDFIRDNPLILDKLKLKINLAQVRAKYPFDIYRSVHATAGLRFDRSFTSASDIVSLDLIDDVGQRISLDLAWVFDNTSEKSINLLTGTRYKAFIKMSNRFDLRLTRPVKLDVSTGLMGILGFDARHYIDLLGYSTLALRVAGQSSFGSEKNIYFLGGVENWFFGQYDNTYPIPKDERFAYKTQAANLRGFDYNIRNGSSFALVNIEIRIPVFSYLFQDHIKAAVLRDFQLVGFFDMGSAWYGLTPFSYENTANVYYHEAPPAILLKIKHFKDPVVGGVGIGLRTTVFGYFLKADYAWGFESGSLYEPKLYLSLGYDF